MIPASKHARSPTEHLNLDDAASSLSLIADVSGRSYKFVTPRPAKKTVGFYGWVMDISKAIVTGATGNVTASAKALTDSDMAAMPEETRKLQIGALTKKQ